MQGLYQTFSETDGLDNQYFIDLCVNSSDPDIILAALLNSFDQSAIDGSLSIDRTSEAVQTTKLAVENLFNVIAKNSRFDTNAIRKMLYRATVDYAQEHKLEIYEGFGDENPFGLNPKAEWVWPEIDVGGTGGEVGDDGLWRPFSALKLFGYTVGKTAGWPPKKRKNFLSDFMEMDLPESVERYFGDEYGSPLTSTRLRKMAYVIANNASSRLRQKDQKRWTASISDWTDDLNFLKEKYYEGYGLKFVPWPDPRD